MKLIHFDFLMVFFLGVSLTLVFTLNHPKEVIKTQCWKNTISDSSIMHRIKCPDDL